MTLLYSIAIHLFYLAMLLTSLFNKKARLWISGRKARRFIRLVKPDSAYFIKYEFWFFYLKQLYGSGIPVYLISGIFRPNQVFFHWYGSWFRNKLRFLKHFFIQDQASAGLLDSIGFQNVTISRDTRFDRVTAIAAASKKMDMAETFSNGCFCIGGGFGKGIQNILEAAAFGIPVIFGPNYHKFREAKELTACSHPKPISKYIKVLIQINRYYDFFK